MKVHAKCYMRRVVCGSDWHRLFLLTMRCSEAKEEENAFLLMRKSDARNTGDQVAQRALKEHWI